MVEEGNTIANLQQESSIIHGDFAMKDVSWGGYNFLLSSCSLHALGPGRGMIEEGKQSCKIIEGAGSWSKPDVVKGHIIL